jgi:hypothetical protein
MQTRDAFRILVPFDLTDRWLIPSEKQYHRLQIDAETIKWTIYAVGEAPRESSRILWNKRQAAKRCSSANMAAACSNSFAIVTRGLRQVGALPTPPIIWRYTVCPGICDDVDTPGGQLLVYYR